MVAYHLGLGVLAEYRSDHLMQCGPLVISVVRGGNSLVVDTANEADAIGDSVDPWTVVAGDSGVAGVDHDTAALDHGMVPTSEGTKFPVLAVQVLVA